MNTLSPTVLTLENLEEFGWDDPRLVIDTPLPPSPDVAVLDQARRILLHYLDCLTYGFADFDAGHKIDAAREITETATRLIALCSAVPEETRRARAGADQRFTKTTWRTNARQTEQLGRATLSLIAQNRAAREGWDRKMLPPDDDADRGPLTDDELRWMDELDQEGARRGLPDWPRPDEIMHRAPIGWRTMPPARLRVKQSIRSRMRTSAWRSRSKIWSQLTGFRQPRMTSPSVRIRGSICRGWPLCCWRTLRSWWAVPAPGRAATWPKSWPRTATASSARVAMQTLTLTEAAAFLKVNPEELRARAKRGLVPGAKVGRRWVFLEADLADYLRSLYSVPRQALRVTSEEVICHYAGEAGSGGSTLPLPMGNEYATLLGLPTKRSRKNFTIASRLSCGASISSVSNQSAVGMMPW